MLSEFISIQMKALFITLSVLFFSLTASAQLAIIQDEDGYTNLRYRPAADAPILTQIKANHVFWYEEPENSDAEWIKVHVSKDRFTLGCFEHSVTTGYIHRSRLLPLDEIDEYQGEDFTFAYTIAPFSRNGRVIDGMNGVEVAAIDGRTPYGTDGGMPTREVKAIDVSMMGDNIPVHYSLFEDLFEILENQTIVEVDGTFVVYSSASDGGASYVVAWVFEGMGLVQRLVVVYPY